MKNLFKTYSILFAISLIFLLASCEVKLDDPSDDDIDSLNAAILTLNSTDQEFVIQGTGSRGDLWKAWDDAFLACFESATFKRKNKVYLGPSNPRYLGTILSRDLNTTKTELQYLIPPADLDGFSTKGIPVKNCDLKAVKTLTLDVLLEAAYGNMDDSLRTAIKRYRNFTITGGEWQNDYLRTDEFMSYINSSNDKKIIAYKNSLLNKKNMVITSVIKIKGFSAEIEVVDSIQGGLKVKLSAGENVPLGDSTKPSGSIDIGLSKTNKRTIKLSSENDFFIYGMVMKGKKLL